MVDMGSNPAGRHQGQHRYRWPPHLARVHREFFRDHPAEFNFMAPGAIYMREYASFVERKCEQLGSAGMAHEAAKFPCARR